MHKYIVDSVERITPSTLLLNLRMPEGERALSFRPGQYAAISFYKIHRPTPARCFSIVSSPTDQNILQFSMRSKGHFTRAIASLRKDDVVKVRGPYGGFVLDLAGTGDAVLLAGGIGITPFMSMVHYANSVKAASKLTLIYSCQNQEDIPFLKDLVLSEQQNPNFKVIFVIGEGPVDKLAGQTVAMGRISPEVIDLASNKQYDNCTFYICGPPPFMRAMTKTLGDKGAAQNRIITEAFAQGSHRQTGKIRSWPYNIYVLSAVGMALGSFTVMVSDMLKALPPSSIIGSSSSIAKSSLANSRQEDLDALVNGLPASSIATPESGAVKNALKAASTTTTASIPSQQSSGGSSQVAVSQPKTTKTTSGGTKTTTPSPTPTPTPPTKTCTTTQSGVTTCI